MAINIQSLFSDIIETPAQRQERMLTEGILRGRELTGGLTGLARTQAPLVSALSMQMPQRQEALRRGVGGMLGLDVRTESEKVQEALQGVDPNNPQSLLQAAQAVGNLGLGTQSAQMRAMAADVARQKQADLMAQQQAATQMAADLARTEQSAEATRQTRLETQITEESVEDRENLRNAMMRQVDASEHLSPREKVDLNLQIQSGGYDNKMSELDNIVSNKPLIFGGRAIVKTDDGWKDVDLGDEPSVQSRKDSLIVSASLQYEPNSNELLVIQDNINNGNITKASEFKNYAPLPAGQESLNIPTAVENRVQEYHQASDSAILSNERINFAINIIDQNNLLAEGSAGLYSSFSEALKSASGNRNDESFLRTAFEREKNQEIINNLPPGVASDRDILIFSKGFPPVGASVSEILTFLETTKKINSYVQDDALLMDSFILEQQESGKFKDATTIGFSQKKKTYGIARQELRRVENDLSVKLENGDLSQEEARSLMDDELSGFQAGFGFIPTMYSF